MKSYLSDYEKKISNIFIKKGYLIFKNNESLLLKEFEKIIKPILLKKFKIKNIISYTKLLNQFHKYIDIKNLNKIRLELISKINSSNKVRELYFKNARKYLYGLVGNELVMQNRINLSIQLPDDKSSLLPIHSDTWSGDSPFEAVVWTPLVNCFNTKSMYILHNKKYLEFAKNFKKFSKKDSDYIFNKIKKDLIWLKVSKGETLLFNQNLPHGNVVNIEGETRWSFNCRFKGIFSPYGDKKIGEFFSPITQRALSEIGMNYNLPETK